MKNIFLYLVVMLSVSIARSQTDSLVTIADSASIAQTNEILTKYHGICGCQNPLTTDQLKQIVSEIRLKHSDVRMLTYAKQVIRDKCLLTNQVKEITLLFTYDDTRANFVKYAYKYTYDQENYRSLAFYRATKANTDFGQEFTKHELHDNWEKTNQSNVILLQRLNADYGNSEILK